MQTLLYRTTEVKRNSDTQSRETLTTCAACGRPFVGRERFTFAAWFFCGTPRPTDIVHLRCRYKQVPASRRETP